MSSLKERLDYLNVTKYLIREALINKGQNVSRTDLFRDYVDKINNIETLDSISDSDLAERIGLTADKIKSGEIILGITGTYTGEDTSP